MPSKEGVPTTEEMDKTTLVGSFRECGEIIRFDNRKGQPRCKCGGRLDSSSIQSQRTFTGVKRRKNTKVKS